MSKIALFRTKAFQLLFIFALALGIGIAFAVDTDNDGMSDLYEDFFQLNSTNSTDAAENYDTDLLNNLQESVLWTDPMATDTDADGFPDDADSNALSRAVIMWGHPDFTVGNDYIYTGPAWWLGAYKSGGNWDASGLGWGVELNNSNSWVSIAVDRSLLTNDVVLGIQFEDTPSSDVRVSLYDASNALVVSNLFGDISSGTDTQVFQRLSIPLSVYPAAARINIQALENTGPFKLYSSVLYIDLDGDGLDSDQELQMGTSDTDQDSDDDGLTDYQEVMIYGTDPLEKHTDGDSLPDGVEVNEYGTDPLLADSDGDGLSDGAEVFGSVYWVVNHKLKFHAAKADAESLGGHLATVPSLNAHRYIKEFVGAEVFEGQSLWLGATDEAEEGVWMWVTGEPIKFTKWASGQPDNKGGNQNWMVYRYSGGMRWFDSGDYAYNYILETTGDLDPLNPDTDGDGLLDGAETLAGLDPLSTDSDHDGLEDSEELALGTDPTIADCDSDGLLDGQEIQLGTDPLNADTDADGLTDEYEVLESRYCLVMKYLTWQEAVQDAEIRGGELVTVTDEEKLRIEQSIGEESLSDYTPWIGLYFLEFDITTVYSGKECVQYWGADKFRSVDEKNTFPYIIEYEAELDPLNPDCDGDGLSDGDELAHGTSPFSADSDGDGLGDAEEVAAGFSPVHSDTDADKLSDIAESPVGSDPLVPDMDGDGLLDGEELLAMTDPLVQDSNTNGLNDVALYISIPGADAVETFNPHSTALWTVSGGSLSLSRAFQEPFAVYEAAVATGGIYRLAIQASWETERPPLGFEPRIDLYIDDVFVETLSAVSGAGILPEYVLFTPWLTAGTHEIKLVPFGNKKNTGMAPGIVVDAVELYTIDGVDTDGNGIDDWMEALMDAGRDTDGDGITDSDEVLVHGSDPLNADSDFDGLADGAELELGTDMLDADSDDDGVVDGVEVNESLTNPLVAEFDGTITVIDSCTGAETNSTVGDWEIQGSELLSKQVRGSVEYTMTFPSNDLVRLVVNAAHIWSKSSCSPAIPKDTSAFLVYIDEVYVGKFPLVSADGVYVDVNAFLPVMPAGQHTVTLFWENVYSRLAVKIQSLELQSLGGPDNNGNGTKDWIEASISSMAGVDGITVPQASSLPCIQSFVSPACLEGDARYVEFMEITGLQDAGDTSTVPQAARLPRRGAGPRWYANLPLEQTDTTTATATFQNGALELPINVEWVPLNLIDHDGETILIRKDDMVKFVALPDDANGGQFEIEYVLGMDGETVRSPNTRPLIYLFPSAGTYTVSGEYTHGNDTVTASIQVMVIDGTFPAASPACLVGREREWTFEGLSSNTVYEVDDTVEMQVLSRAANVTNQSSIVTKVALRANDTNGDHTMLARLYEGGPILDSTQLDTFWIQNATDGYFWTVESYEDSELWEVRSVAKNVPDSVDVQIKVIVGGVTLDDYTLERWLTNTAYNDIGEYNFRLFHPNDEQASTCHTFKLYQDGVFVGEVY